MTCWIECFDRHNFLGPSKRVLRGCVNLSLAIRAGQDAGSRNMEQHFLRYYVAEIPNPCGGRFYTRSGRFLAFFLLDYSLPPPIAMSIQGLLFQAGAGISCITELSSAFRSAAAEQRRRMEQTKFPLRANLVTKFYILYRAQK